MSLETALLRAKYRYYARNYTVAHKHYKRSGRLEYMHRSLTLFDQMTKLHPLCQFR